MEDADHGSIGRRALILRVEIESLGEQLASLLVNDARVEPLPEDDAHAKEIAEAEAQLEEQRARLQAEAERLDRLATELAEREADVFIREERLEEKEAELSALEQRLRRKETELMIYVAQVQEQLATRGSVWDPVAAALGG